MEDCKLTILTPAYNRIDCIVHCYESLCRQANKNFIWMVIDDGSTDHVDALIHQWQQEDNGFSIEFYQKENGGKSTTYNLALEHIKTPYWTCIDSDDWAADNVVERYYYWIERTKDLKVAGFVGLDASPDGTILGGHFPYQGITHLIDIKTKIKHNGDMNMVYRTDICKELAPMPTVKGEKDFEPYYFLLQIDEVAPLYMVDEVFIFADYQPDGLSQNVWRAYYRSPISMGMLRMEFLKRKNLPKSFVFRQCIHYVSSWLLCQRYPEKKDALPNPTMGPLMILAWVPGWLLSRMTIYKNKKRMKRKEE